jgi:uncharacterized protein YyaL (SSP411 family)
VTERGNFEGKNILSVVKEPDVLAHQWGLSVAEVEQRLAVARAQLFARREQRVKPARDEKVLTAWNGLMMAALAEAARQLSHAGYLAAAQRNAAFLLSTMRQPDGRLLRTWKSGRAHLNGYLEDYAYLIDGLLTLYETDFNARWFVAARELADYVLAHFADPAGGFFDTSDDHEQLVLRPKNIQDNATPSGNALFALDLLRLEAFTGERDYGEPARRALVQAQPLLARNPVFFAQWLQALDFATAPIREIAIIGQPGAPDTEALISAVRAHYDPRQVVAAVAPDSEPMIPLLRGRTLVDGQAAAYVCRNFVCALPVTDPAALAKQLEAA